EPLPVAAEDAPYFWTQGDAAVPRGGPAFGFTYEWPNFNKPVRRLIRSKPGADPAQPGPEPQVWLECVGNIVERIPAEGSGFWSPSLPAVPGSRLRISYQMSGEGIEAAGEGGGPTAFVRFQSLTGQKSGILPLPAALPDGKITFPWHRSDAEIVVPEFAGRFAVFFGLKPARGSVRYADIRIDTQPAAPSPPEAAPVRGRYTPIDLSAHFNRDLDKDMGAPAGAPPADDFSRDMCSLPVIDLSGVRPGRFTAGDVPFEVSRAVSLRSFRRPPLTLPLEASNIPVGRKVNALYFLHPGPFQMGAQEYWRYLIRYEDGQTAEVVPIADAADLRYRKPYFLPGAGAVQSAPPSQGVSGVGGVLRWLNPRPEVPVRSLDFRSMDTGQAVLLAVTAQGE
ncbi:MAG: hypothetical protein IT210_24710, partial [Armatimonadetes bacterium]|nr:hypothetical protein [Armatimonadota bacterium]